MKADIISRLDELAHQEKVMSDLNEFNDLVSEFYKIQEEEERQWEIKKLERIEAGEKAEAIEKPVYEHLEEFKRLSTLFKDKKKIEQNAQRDLEKANLEKKKALIAAFTDLIQNEENIGRAIGRFKDIQESWKEVGPIPRDKRQAVQQEFSSLVESFRYNINIYKDIKDHDLNRNLKLKKDLIENIKALVDLKKIKEIEEKLHAYQDEWNNIGGTHQEEWEKIKDEYWTSVNAVYEKIHKFYQERREAQAENLEKKKALIVKVQEITAEVPTDHKTWKKVTDKVLAVQEEWKTIGYGPKEENDKVWKEFRGVCNVFFDAKKEFFGERNSEFEGIKEKKEALIEEVAVIKESTDWKGTTQKIMNIQKRWKELGSAGPKFENKLWKKFRDNIDFFFNAKDAHFEKADAAGKENLEAKEALIKEIENYIAGKDNNKTVEDLKAFSARFAEIGNVPFKQKDRIYKSYKTALDAKYDAIKMDAAEKAKLLFESKLTSLLGGKNQEESLDRERTAIRQKIGGINAEIAKLETNMAFFANADESNPLFKSVNQNIAKLKAEIDGYKAQLKMINVAANAASKKAEEAAGETETAEGAE
ncbi:MAG: DUF349 domain-containing protein [Crocinitomicaceae bacterium]